MLGLLSPVIHALHGAGDGFATSSAMGEARHALGRVAAFSTPYGQGTCEVPCFHLWVAARNDVIGISLAAITVGLRACCTSLDSVSLPSCPKTACPSWEPVGMLMCYSMTQGLTGKYLPPP